MSRAESALNEFLEAVIEHRITDRNIEVEASFNEFNLDVDIRYREKMMEFPAQSPDLAKILEDKAEQLKLSGFLMKKYSDKTTGETKDGVSCIPLHFGHKKGRGFNNLERKIRNNVKHRLYIKIGKENAG